MAPEASVAQLIEEDQADAFLETLLGAAERGWPPGISRSAWGYSDNYAESLQHERSGWRSAPPEAHHWWQETLDSLRIAFADADRFALHWLCASPERRERVVRLLWPNQPAASGHVRDPHDPTEEVLRFWIESEAVAGAAERIVATIRDGLVAHRQSQPVWDRQPWERGANILTDFGNLKSTLDHLLADAPEHRLDTIRPLFDLAVGYTPDTRFGCGFWLSVLEDYGGDLWIAGRLAPAVQQQLLLTHARYGHRFHPQLEPTPLYAMVQETIRAMVDEGIANGRLRRDLLRALNIHCCFQDIEDMARVLNWLQRRSPNRGDSWVAWVLARLSGPTAEDMARAGSLSSFPSDDLFAVGVLCPKWSGVIGEALPATERQALEHVSRFVAPFLDCPPWCRWCGGKHWDQRDFVADRSELTLAVAAVGEHRLQEFLAHKLLRTHAAPPILAIGAALDWNRAEITAGLAKRDKWSVVASGLLPDQDDVPDRYQMLREFADEASQFGARREASERRAVAIARAYLTVTSGYDDLESLTWALDAPDAGRPDPARRAWTIGDYHITLGADDRATIQAARQGKRLQAVPGSIRAMPIFAVIRGVQGQARATFSRVRHRLERAASRGELLKQADWDHLLSLSAGQIMIPRLVLRVLPLGVETPLTLLNGRTLDGTSVTIDRVAWVQLPHSLQLTEDGTLAAWQRQVVESETRQPFNQLFRPHYRLPAATHAPLATQQFAGHSVRRLPLRHGLLRRGWVATREWKYTFRRRFPGGIVAELASSGEEISDGPAERSEFAAVGELIVRPPDTLAGGSGALDPLAWSEALRDVDLATMAAIADPATFVPSPAVVAMRASLVRAFLPEAIVDNTSARLPGGILSLANGAVQAPDGSPLPLPEMPKPAYFPYPNPDAGTVQVVARALHLATRAKSG